MVSREYGHRFWDGSAAPDESRDAALEYARRFNAGSVEIVWRTGPDEPWVRDRDQPHSPDERIDALAGALKAEAELSLWRATRLTDLGLSPNPLSWSMTSHLITWEWGNRTRMPDGSLEEQCVAGEGHGTGEAFARKRMALPNWPHHRALIRRPVVRGRWETVEEKPDAE